MTLIFCSRCHQALRIPSKEVAQTIDISPDNASRQARTWGRGEGICAKNRSGHWRWCEACFPDAFLRHGFYLKGSVSRAPRETGQLPSIELRQQTFSNEGRGSFRSEKPVSRYVDVPIERVIEKIVEKEIEKVVYKTRYRIMALVSGLFLGLGYIVSDGQPRAYLEDILWPQDRSGSETSLAPHTLKPQS